MFGIKTDFSGADSSVTFFRRHVLLCLTTFTFWSLLTFSCSLSLSWEMILKTISAVYVRCWYVLVFSACALEPVPWEEAGGGCSGERCLAAPPPSNGVAETNHCKLPLWSAWCVSWRCAILARCLWGNSATAQAQRAWGWSHCHTEQPDGSEIKKESAFSQVYFELRDSASHTVRWTVVVVTTCTVLFESDIWGSIQLQLWAEPTSALRLVGPRSFGRHAGM